VLSQRKVWAPLPAGILEFTESVLSIRPYPWQRTTLCHIEAGHPTALVACNGAGKTPTIFVSAALWTLFSWPRARVIVTSASWSQLKKRFFDAIRERQSHPLMRRYTFNEPEIRTPEGGFCIGISKDEAGRVEGYVRVKGRRRYLYRAGGYHRLHPRFPSLSMKRC
jgi:hypothetical protein